MSRPSADGNNVLIGRGAVYFDRLTPAGIVSGLQFLGNCTPFDLSITDTLSELFSSVEHTSPLVKSVTKQRLIEASISLFEFIPSNIALGLMGLVGSLVETGATITDESHAHTVQGTWVALAHGGISAVTVTVGVTAKTLGTDYLVDAQNGMIYIIPGGGIAADATILVDYTFVSATMPTIAVGASSVIEGRLLFIGDPATGPPYRLEFWKASVSPTGSVGFIADDYGNFPLKFKVLADATNHPTEPYGRATGLAPLILAIG